MDEKMDKKFEGEDPVTSSVCGGCYIGPHYDPKVCVEATVTLQCMRRDLYDHVNAESGGRALILQCLTKDDSLVCIYCMWSPRNPFILTVFEERSL